MSIHKIASAGASTGERNVHNEENIGRKRTWKMEEEIDIDRRPLILHSDQSDPFAKPLVFTPVCLLSRSQLPLIYLDSAFSGSKPFTAHVNILEACYDVKDEHNILIVENKVEIRLYAIERVHFRTYALCKLSTWVQKRHILQKADVPPQSDEPPQKRHDDGKEGGKSPWWACAAIELPQTSSIGTVTKIPKFRMDVDLVSNVQQCEVPKSDSTPAATGEQMQLPPCDRGNGDLPGSSPLSAQDVLSELSKQYLDALYLSRTSLAYFSKGPLSRARAAFSSNNHLSLLQMELVDYLRGSLLSATVMDKKFRESVPEKVKELPVDVSSTPLITKRAKKRKWKPKRDKSGFFTDEKEYVMQWWRKCEDMNNDLNSTNTPDALLRTRMHRLRSREAFLQIILILEIVALTAGCPPHDVTTTAVKSEDAEIGESRKDHSNQVPRNKKSINITDTLESLLDRLCIWYSLENTSPSKSTESHHGKDTTNDDLKNFCVEIIVPFYMSRIPEQAAMVSKKLGGPEVSVPAKRRPNALSQRPGEPASRQAPEKKARKRLYRTSTDLLHKSDHPPSLIRSTTDSAALAPLIKRELNEGSLSPDSIPSTRTNSKQPLLRKRASLMHEISFSKREVDLSAWSQANEIKMRKKADVEEKLREAIGTLKKPNRNLAVKEIADDVDESFAKAIRKGRANAPSHRKKPERVRQTVVNSTPRHIKATPAHHRQQQQPRANYVDSSNMLSASTDAFAAALAIPSCTPAVPQTRHRPREGSAYVEETPSRGFARYMPAGLARQPGTLLESPTATRIASIAQTPTRPLRMPSLQTPSVMSSAKEWPAITANLNASPDSNAAAEDSGIVLSVAGNESKSVYDTLGWNDEYEDLA